jgi:hypothetical protein
MADPSSITTVTIGDLKFNALSSQVGISTNHDDKGIPLMGSVRMGVDLTINIHDADAVPFSVVTGLFDLANRVTRDKIKPIKIEYWVDELRQDAILTYSFEGWVSSFNTTSGSGSNHTLHIQLQPRLDEKQFMAITLGN